MSKKKFYFSIRVVKAISEEQAIDKICTEEFVEEHNLCDKVLTLEELKEELNKLV